MKIAGAIGVDRKPRQRKTLAERIREQDEAIERLEQKLIEAKNRRAMVIETAKRKAEAQLAEIGEASR